MRVARRIAAPRDAVYAALLDAEAVARWRVPDGMSSEVHRFEPRTGGAIRVSLTYDSPGGEGKTSGATDTYGGRFVELVPGRRVVESLAFETGDPSLQGEITITTTLTELPGGATEVAIGFDGMPTGVRAEDNELGTRMALERLAALLEAPGRHSGTSWNVSA